MLKLGNIKARTSETSSGCWEWTGSRVPNGYGRLVRRVGGKAKMWLAHRFSWFLKNGPIPDGMVICHICDNPPCINPAHLFLGTHKENTQDAIKKGRFKGFSDPRSYPKWRPGRLFGEDSNSSKLARVDIKTIRHLYYAERRLQREIAEFYGVAQQTISAVLTGKVWGHVDNRQN